MKTKSNNKLTEAKYTWRAKTKSNGSELSMVYQIILFMSYSTRWNECMSIVHMVALGALLLKLRNALILIFTPDLCFLAFWLAGRAVCSSLATQPIVALKLLVVVEEERAVIGVGERKVGKLEAALPSRPRDAFVGFVWAWVVLAAQDVQPPC